MSELKRVGDRWPKGRVHLLLTQNFMGNLSFSITPIRLSFCIFFCAHTLPSRAPSFFESFMTNLAKGAFDLPPPHKRTSPPMH